VQDEQDRDAILAWRIANLQRAKTLPAIATLLSRRARPKQQTVSQQRTMLHILSAQYGGALRPYQPSPRRDG